jgi:hypothetical protein
MIEKVAGKHRERERERGRKTEREEGWGPNIPFKGMPPMT